VCEYTPHNNHVGGLEHYWQSPDPSQGSELLFDCNQASYARGLQMLGSDPVNLGNSQELMLRLVQEGPGDPGFGQSAILQPGRLAGKGHSCGRV